MQVVANVMVYLILLLLLLLSIPNFQIVSIPFILYNIMQNVTSNITETGLTKKPLSYGVLITELYTRII